MVLFSMCSVSLTINLSSQVGFLLGPSGLSIAPTSEACFKSISKTSTCEVVVSKDKPELFHHNRNKLQY